MFKSKSKTVFISICRFRITCIFTSTVEKKIKNPYLVTHQIQLGISRNKEDIIRMTNIFTVPKNLVTCSLLDLSLSQIFRRNHFKIQIFVFSFKFITVILRKE